MNKKSSNKKSENKSIVPEEVIKELFLEFNKQTTLEFSHKNDNPDAPTPNKFKVKFKKQALNILINALESINETLQDLQDKQKKLYTYSKEDPKKRIKNINKVRIDIQKNEKSSQQIQSYKSFIQEATKNNGYKENKTRLNNFLITHDDKKKTLASIITWFNPNVELKRIIQPISLKNKYKIDRRKKYSSEVTTENFKNLKDKYKDIRGSRLKYDILENFKADIELAKNISQLQKKVNDFKRTDEYKILKTGQNVTTKKLGLKTSSVKEMEKMIRKMKTSLKKEKKEEKRIAKEARKNNFLW